jgi:L-2,4-diaminobutyrate decarboxylase
MEETELQQSRERIDAAYSPQLLREAGLRLVDQLARHMTKMQAAEGPVLPWRAPAENVAQAASFLEQKKPATADQAKLADHFQQLVQTMLSAGQNLHHRHYIGHQVPAPVPIAGWFDAVGAVTNQVMAIYDMGPWATAVEHALVDRLGQQIGYRQGEFAGLITHGGSLANLTGLLTARNVTLRHSWGQGLAESLSPVLVVHHDAHYGVDRAAGILGIGTQNIVRIQLDDRRRMNVNHLDETLAALRAVNRPIVAVVACACATPIGAFDPLDDVTDVCRRHDVWLHVDAAHGGSACFSQRQRHLVDGLHRADSVVWDAHKMMFVPALCAFVFYKNKSHQYETFRQDAPYLFDPSAPGQAEFDSGLTTIECTKRAAAYGLWGLWSLFGPQLFADLVDVTFDLAQRFYDLLCHADDFEPLHLPQCNIVAFRYLPSAMRQAAAERISKLQFAVRRKVIESGDFYIVSTKLDGQGALRATIINPLTTEDDLRELLTTIRQHGRPLAAG